MAFLKDWSNNVGWQLLLLVFGIGAISLELGSSFIAEVKASEGEDTVEHSTVPADSRSESVLVPMFWPELHQTPPLEVDTLAGSSSGQITPNLGYDPHLWDTITARIQFLTAIDYSLAYLATPEAEAAYTNYPNDEFSRRSVIRSLQRLRQLVLLSPTPEALQQSVLEEFAFYRSIGQDGEGTVAFTGYFEPTYAASRVPTEEYRYPLYRRPANLDEWPLPHPTRLDLEGIDGLQASQGPLKGLELVWLKDRLEAFLVQVQGSARLRLPDGTTLSVGYAGRTEYPYTSIGRALVEDGLIPETELSLPAVKAYFADHPAALDTYLPRNQRFIFFKATDGNPPTGSLSVPVTAGRSIATDKSLMPPGAPALIVLPLPTRAAGTANWTFPTVNRFVLDQDTGGAIQGPGRVDLFVGSGESAGEQAGLINATGELYYLLLKD